MGREKERKSEREREEGSYFTRGRVTCLFRVVEQIYIALSPPVIPLCRCCCRMLDSVHQREIKGEKAGWERENEGKKENGRKKNEKYRILKYRRPRRGAAKCPARYVCTARERAFISPRSCICRRLSTLRRCEPFIFGSALRPNRRRVKPACPRQS